jgi:hypothetical protein
MNDFTVQNALMTGVGLIKRRPLLILLWVFLLLLQSVFFAVIGAKMLAGLQAAGGPRGALAGPFFAYTLGISVLSLVLTALLWASAFRALLRPTDTVPLGFGLEELCIFVSQLIVQLLLGIVSSPLAILFIGRFGVSGRRMDIYAVTALGVAALLWSAIASAWAFDHRRVGLFRCWNIAKDRFWLLAGLIVGVGVLQRLAEALFRRLLVASRPGAAADPFQALSDPALLSLHVLLAVIGALAIAIVAGIVACAYRAGRPEHPAAVFA